MALALLQCMTVNEGLTYGPNMKRDIAELATEIAIPEEEVRQFFLEYILANAVEKYLGVSDWSVETPE